ncbi:MAG: hypothetical protein U0Z53_26715 [Blastocatellia bacterium]
MVYLKGLIVWLILILAETLHGILRTLLLAPYVGDFRARQIAVLSGALIILTMACLFVRWLRAENKAQLLGIGLIWVLLTVSFEITLGRLLHYSWERILSDYNLPEGGLLSFGLLVMALSPLIAARLRGLKSGLQ